MSGEVFVEPDASPADDDVDQVVRGLIAFNARHVQSRPAPRLAAFVRDVQGRVRGGAVGTVRWNWLFISHLWLDDDLRGRGLGRAVMATMEQLASEHGCDAVHLDTLDFQALGFYERLGFRKFGELADYPTGHTKHFLWKPIGEREPPGPRSG